MKDILVITMGGTIDSHYDPGKGTPYVVPQSAQSAVPFALEQLGLHDRCHVHAHCMKDSKDVTRKDLYDAVAMMKKQYDKIIITHGTDRMPANARAIRQILARQRVQDKTVIFTGAMEPLRDEDGAIRPQADGWENLRKAVESADTAPPGVYVVIGGRLYEADAIDKKVTIDERGMVTQSGFVERSIRSSEQMGLGLPKR